MSKVVLLSKSNPKCNMENMNTLFNSIKELSGKENPKIGYLSFVNDDKTFQNFCNNVDYYAQFGMTNMKYFYFCKEFNIENLLECDIIHLPSGNSFEMLDKIKYTKYFDKLREFKGVFVGVSAGSILLTMNIKSAQFADINSTTLSDLKALNMVDFLVKPHWNDWEDKKQLFVDFSKEEKSMLIGIKDGDGVIVEDDVITFIGEKIII